MTRALAGLLAIAALAVAAPDATACARPGGVQTVTFSAAKYPHIRAHALAAIAVGWPTILVVHRLHASERRDHALRGIPSLPGEDRDEYPPAVGRATWPTNVDYVPSGENRSHGASLGAKLRDLCAGTRFRYAFA